MYFLAAGDTARLVIPGSTHAEYMDGQLLYLINDVLFASPFDAAQGEFTGDPRTVTGGVLQSKSYSSGFFTAASGGNIAYLKAAATSSRARLIQYSRKGEVVATWDIGDEARDLTISPAGRRVAFSKYKEDSDSIDIWILDLDRGVQSRITFTDDADDPFWSPDGKRLAYAGNGNLFVIPASGVGEPQQITDTMDDDCTHQWSADGRFLVWSRSGKNLEL